LKDSSHQFRLNCVISFIFYLYLIFHAYIKRFDGIGNLKNFTNTLFVSLVYYAESTVRWFVVREKHCWMAADSADKSKRTG
jgi:hypothetical protein